MTTKQLSIRTSLHIFFQCTTAITTIWAESSWAFPESYTTGLCAQAMADNGETKGLITFSVRVLHYYRLFSKL